MAKARPRRRQISPGNNQRPAIVAGVVRLADQVSKSCSLSLTEAFLDQGSDGIDVSWRDFTDTRVLV
jgi:hypothetical protein